MENYFATNLKHLRVQKGLTQAELAKKIDKDYSTIGKWELGQRSPVMADVIKISDFFEIPLEALVCQNMLNNSFDPLETLINKHKNILTDGDKAIIKTVIDERKKEVEKK